MRVSWSIKSQITFFGTGISVGWLRVHIVTLMFDMAKLHVSCVKGGVSKNFVGNERWMRWEVTLV